MATDEIEPVSDERIERYVWAHVGKESARDMAKALGVSPEEILRVKRSIVEEVDAISIEVQKARLMRTLQEIADDAKEEFEHAPAEFKSGLLNSSVSAIKTLLVELNRTSKQDSAAVESLNLLRTRELTSLMLEVVDATVPLIAERYEIPEQDIFLMFNDAFTRAVARRDAL